MSKELYGIVNGAGEWLCVDDAREGEYEFYDLFQLNGECWRNVVLSPTLRGLSSKYFSLVNIYGGTIAHFLSGEPVNMIKCRYDEKTEIVSWHRLGEDKAMSACCVGDISDGVGCVFLVKSDTTRSGFEWLPATSVTPAKPYFNVKTKTVHN